MKHETRRLYIKINILPSCCFPVEWNSLEEHLNLFDGVLILVQPLSKEENNVS